jgi:hypothetical protein
MTPRPAEAEGGGSTAVVCYIDSLLINAALLIIIMLPIKP